MKMVRGGSYMGNDLEGVNEVVASVNCYSVTKPYYFR